MTRLRAERARSFRIAGRVVVGGLLLSTVSVQAFATVRVFASRNVVPSIATGYPRARVFYSTQDWVDWAACVEWVNRNAPAGALVATDSPHTYYLWTGRPGIFPPFEFRSREARRLLDAAKVAYVIIDGRHLLQDAPFRYVLPALRHNPEEWNLSYEHGSALVYERRKN